MTASPLIQRFFLRYIRNFRFNDEKKKLIHIVIMNIRRIARTPHHINCKKQYIYEIKSKALVDLYTRVYIFCFYMFKSI